MQTAKHGEADASPDGSARTGGNMAIRWSKVRQYAAFHPEIETLLAELGALLPTNDRDLNEVRVVTAIRDGLRARIENQKEIARWKAEQAATQSPAAPAAA